MTSTKSIISAKSELPKNPWKRNSSKVVYSNPWISVREDQVICPDGRPGIYGVVETKIATGVLAITENEEVYLVGQYRYPLDLYSWEIVEGGAERGEDPRDAAQRELQEEAGLSATSFEPLGPPFYLSNCFSNEVAYLYLARGLSNVGASPEPTEVLALRQMPFSTALEMADRGEITDAITVVALLRYARLRELSPRHPVANGG